MKKKVLEKNKKGKIELGRAETWFVLPTKGAEAALSCDSGLNK